MSPPEGGRYNGKKRPYGRRFVARFLAEARFFGAVRVFLMSRAAFPARWTARHMYQLATVR